MLIGLVISRYKSFFFIVFLHLTLSVNLTLNVAIQMCRSSLSRVISARYSACNFSCHSEQILSF